MSAGPADDGSFQIPRSAHSSLTRRQLVRSALGTAGLLLLSACAPPVPSPPASSAATPGVVAPTSQAAGATSSAAGGSLTLSQWSAPGGFNPLTVADQYAYQDIALMFASLTRLNDKLEVLPELAEKWEVSPDTLTYTYHLNPKAKWHDGQPVTAKDVVFTYRLVADKDIPATSYSRLTSIKGFSDYHDGKAEAIEGLKAVDDQTLQIVLAQPDAAFLTNLSKSDQFTNEILPEHLLGSVKPADLATHAFWNAPVGSGPYKFVSYAQNQALQLAAFADYVLGAPKVQTLFMRIGAQDVLLAQLERGEVDYAWVPAPEFDRTRALPNVAVTEIPSITFQAIYPNQSKDYLKDVRVRKALVYALDRQAMAKSILLGHGEVVKTPIAAPQWAVNMEVTDYPYDPARAKQLLQEAGWDPSRKLVIRLGSGNKVREQSAPVIQQYLKAVGIDSDINLTDFATVVKDMQAGTFDLALVGHLSGADPDYTAIWSATDSWPPKGNNFPRYSNPRVDELLKQGRATIGTDKRKLIYDEYQKIIVDEVAMAWLYRPTDIYGVAKRVIGNQFGPGAYPFWNIRDWTLQA